MPRAAARSSMFALAAAPALIPLYVILHYGIDFPFWDQWDEGISGMFIKAHEGRLGIGDLWAQHNEHRIIVPRVVYLVLGLATRWNTVAEMIVSWVLAGVSSAGVLWLCRKSAGAVRSGSVLFPWFLCNACIFSIVQWENWLTGVGMVNVMGVTWLIGMVVALSLEVSPKLRAGAGMTFAMLATFTSGGGMICWVLGAVLLGWSGSWEELKARRWMLLAWGIGLVVSVGLYFIGYETATYNVAKPPSVPDRVLYFLGFLGAPYAPVLALGWARTAVLFGVGQLVLYALAAAYFGHVWFVRRDRRLGQGMLTWLVIGTYPMFAGAMGAVARAHFDLLQAASSRYTTFSLLLSIALVNLLTMICSDRIGRIAASPERARIWLRLPAAGAALVLWLQITLLGGTPAYIDRSLAPHYSMKAAMLLMEVLPNSPWLRPNGFPEFPGMEDRARALDRMGYLRPGLIRSPDIARIEAPESQAEIDKGRWGAIQQAQTSSDRSSITLSGYALRPDGDAPADAVLLTIENELKQPIVVAIVAVNGPRLDIAEQHRRARLVGSGWAWTVPLSHPPPIFLAAWAFDTNTGKAYKLGGQLAIVE